MTFEEKIIDLFKRYDVLLVQFNGKVVPVKNTTKQECYDLLYDIQELIEWRKNDFKQLDFINANMELGKKLRTDFRKGCGLDKGGAV